MTAPLYDLGVTIRVIRTIRGMSLDELARRLGGTPDKSNLSRAERTGAEMSIRTASRIAAAFGLTLQEMLAWQPPPLPPQPPLPDDGNGGNGVAA